MKCLLPLPVNSSRYHDFLPESLDISVAEQLITDITSAPQIIAVTSLASDLKLLRSQED